MPCVAATLKEIRDQFRLQISDLRRLLATYCTVEMATPATMRIWTILDGREEETEEALARAEINLAETFPQVLFDFTTIHLRGRDPIQFIPDGAVAIQIRDDRVLAHFERALTAA